MIPIITTELKQRRTALFWWTVASVILSVGICALYPSIRDQAQQLDKVVNQLPEGLRGLKTGGVASVSMADPMEFLNAQLFYATLPMIWIILTITRGGSILGRDEQNHTLELLLARPISRTKLLTAKALGLVIDMLIVGGVTTAAIAVAAPVFDLKVAASKIVLASALTAVFCLSFGYLTFALQATGVAKRMATAVAVALSFGGYILASLSGLTDWLKTPAKLAPFHYFSPLEIMRGHMSTGLTVYLLGVLVLGTLAAYFGFRHRDLE